MSLLSQALESHDSKEDPIDDGKLIVMQGPLSEVIYRAMNIVFAKDDNPDTNLSLESQAQEVVLSQKIINAASQDEENKIPDYIVFGVARQDVEPQILVDVRNIIETKDEDTELIVLTETPVSESKELQETAPYSGEVKYEDALNTALESLVKTHGGRVFHRMDTLLFHLQ